MFSIIKSSRSFAWSYLPDTAVVIRRSGATDALGGVANTESEVSRIRCRLAPVNHLTASEVERVSPSATAVVYSTHDAAVSVGDRLTVKGRVFSVLEIDTPSSFGILTRMFCAEVK